MDYPVNILLVDDEARNLDALETVLASPGYRLVRAQTANGALIELLNAEFAVIVLDVQMPETSGIELAQIIKQRKATQGIPIIFLTAYYQDEKDVLVGYGTGAVDYLSKPVNPQILRSKVAVFVELFRKTRALAETNATLAAEVVERQRAERALAEKNLELQQANVAKDRFLANMSHELRTPLNSMLMLAHLLAENHQGNLTGKQVEHARIIASAGNDLLDLINDVLDLAAIGAGKMTMQTAPVRLAAIGEDLDKMFAPLAAEKNLHLSVRLAPDLPDQILTDGKRLQQILKNLLSNAIKFTQSGAVDLTMAAVGGEISFTVADTGIGIPTDHMESIFEAFHQVDSSFTRSHSGTGLGLSICRQLSAMLGGRLTAESRLGSGSRFTLLLPNTQAPAKSPPHGAIAPRSGAPRLGGYMALVVDDDRRSLFAMYGMLEQTGMSVQTALSGKAALAALAGGEEKPDVILLDVMMPEMDGYTVLARIRTLAAHASTPVIAVTAAAMPGDKEKILAAGFDDYIAKPICPDALVALLERRLATEGEDR